MLIVKSPDQTNVNRPRDGVTVRRRWLLSGEPQDRLRVLGAAALMLGVCGSSASAQQAIDGRAQSVDHRPVVTQPLTDPEPLNSAAAETSATAGNRAAAGNNAAPPGEAAESSDAAPQRDAESSMQLAPPANEAHLLFLGRREHQQPENGPQKHELAAAAQPTSDKSRLIVAAESLTSRRDYRTQAYSVGQQQPYVPASQQVNSNPPPNTPSVAQLFEAWTTTGRKQIRQAGTEATATEVTAVEVAATEAAATEVPARSQNDSASPSLPDPAGVSAESIVSTSNGYFRTTTANSRRADAQQQLARAMHEYSVHAWASSEQSAWQALRIAAESVDLANSAGAVPCRDAQSALEDARQAIREATHFSGCYGDTDPEAIARLVQSHRTPVLHGQSLQNMTASEATDRYLNEARIKLSSIAANSVEAAQAMDLLAAVYLSRGDAATLPSSTALCLRRAALQGQPENPHLAAQLGLHLAAMDLLEEAKWALEHSLALQPNAEIAATLQQVLRRTGEAKSAQPLARVARSRHTRRSAEFAPVPSQAFASSTTLPAEPSPAALSSPAAFPSPATLPSPNTVPEVVRLTPGEFAALSQSVMLPTGEPNVPTEVSASTVAHRNQSAVQPGNGNKSTIRKVVESLGNLW